MKSTDAFALSRLQNGQALLLCHGFVPWKRSYTRQFFQALGRSVEFVDDSRRLKQRLQFEEVILVLWGLGVEPSILAEAKAQKRSVWRIEDGFIRSVGLGKHYVPPLSLVVDQAGIYFDPRTCSDLEQILAESRFESAELSRAEALREQIVAMKLSKYNVGLAASLELAVVPGQKVILVPGQVEADASIAAGCTQIKTNLALLQAVRAQHPQAYVIYKPHPDVLSGNEVGNDQTAWELADWVAQDVRIDACLEVVDEVHTLTSLVGFEALLRNKRVTTYGQPFYAGWGLTNDQVPVARRARQLTLPELVAGVILRYPLYFDWAENCFISAEQAVQQLAEQARDKRVRIEQSWLQRKGRKVVNLVLSLARRTYNDK